MRTGGDAGGSSMGGGRLTPRPDTLRPGTRAGSGPAPQSQEFIGRLIVITSGAPNTGLFVYNGTPALGNPPVLSIVAPGVTQDPYSNPVSSILKLYGPGGTSIQLTFSSVIGANIPAALFATGVTEEGTPGQLQAAITSPGASEVMTFYTIGPRSNVASHTDYVYIALDSAAKNGSATAGGALAYVPAAGGLHFWLVWGATGTKVFSAITGDSTTYQPERNTSVQTSNVLITAGPTQFMNTLNPGNGRYVVEGQIMITPTAAGGTAQFEFSGGTLADGGVIFEEIAFTAGGGGYVTGNAQEVTALASNYTTTTLGANSRRINFRGSLNFTTGAAFGIFATAAGGASYNIIADATFMHMYPVGP